MARRIAGEGLVTVSERRSITMAGSSNDGRRVERQQLGEHGVRYQPPLFRQANAAVPPAEKRRQSIELGIELARAELRGARHFGLRDAVAEPQTEEDPLALEIARHRFDGVRLRQVSLEVGQMPETPAVHAGMRGRPQAEEVVATPVLEVV